MMGVISMKIMDTIGFVENVDKEVGEAMEAELARQRRNLELIASENIVSPAVMAAMGSVLTNKYAEGYSGKRYYGGCQCVDVVEDIAVEKEPASFSVLSMLTFSHILALRLTLLFILLFLSQATLLWV